MTYLPPYHHLEMVSKFALPSQGLIYVPVLLYLKKTAQMMLEIEDLLHAHHMLQASVPSTPDDEIVARAHNTPSPVVVPDNHILESPAAPEPAMPTPMDKP